MLQISFASFSWTMKLKSDSESLKTSQEINLCEEFGMAGMSLDTTNDLNFQLFQLFHCCQLEKKTGIGSLIAVHLKLP